MSRLIRIYTVCKKKKKKKKFWSAGLKGLKFHLTDHVDSNWLICLYVGELYLSVNCLGPVCITPSM